MIHFLKNIFFLSTTLGYPDRYNGITPQKIPDSTETSLFEDIYSKFPKEYIFLVVAASGVLHIVGAIRDWDWMLQGDGRPFNMAWISHAFGRKTARILVGINGAIVTVLGIFLFVLDSLDLYN